MVVMTIAVTVGTLSGYYGGRLDTLLKGLVDLLLAFPGLILAVAYCGDARPQPDKRDDSDGRSMVGRLRPPDPRHGALATAARVCGSGQSYRS